MIQTEAHKTKMINDLRYTVRLLRKTPGFTFATIGVMALGLSLYLSSATLGKMMSDEPLPFPDGDRYVSLKSIYSPSVFDVGQHNFDLYTFNQLREVSESYSALGAFHLNTSAISNEESARQYSSAIISVELLNATQQAPLLGRGFTPNDSLIDADRVALISHTVWQDFYNGDPQVIGRTSLIDGELHSIIGVMPEEFHFPLKQDIWTPLVVSDAIQPTQGIPVSIAGVLADGIDSSIAELEINSLYTQILDRFPESYLEGEHRVFPFASLNWAKASPMNDLAFVVEATGLIILGLTIINLSSLLLIRSTARQSELQIRSSVGASRLQLSKQVLSESLIICLAGLFLGLLLTSILLPLVQSQMENEVGRLDFWFNLSLDFGALSTGVLLTLIVWFVSGMLAAYRAFKSDTGPNSISTNKTTSNKGDARANRAIVVVELVFTCFLLICCGAVIYLFDDFAKTDFGFAKEEYVVAEVQLDAPLYSSAQNHIAYLDNLERSIQSLPNVLATSITTAPPGANGTDGFYNLDDRDLARNQQLPSMMSIWTKPDYFELLSFQISEGRGFDITDTSDSSAVTIISDEFAASLWPNETAMGKQIVSVHEGIEERLTVVGTFPGIMQYPIELNIARPALYRPISQSRTNSYSLIAQVSNVSSLSELRQQFESAAASVDRRVVLRNFNSLDAEIAGFLGVNKVVVQIFIAFGLATLLLAAIGIYGVIARSIATRTREIGVRRALGSSNNGIVYRYLKQGANFLLVGFLLGGLPASLIMVAAVPALFSGIDLVNFVIVISLTVVLIMSALVLMSSLIPARKAIALEPGDALRYE